MSGLFLVPEAVGLQLLLSSNSAISNIIARAACTAVGVVYPVYASFKSLEARRVEPHRLAYWSIFGLTSFVESFLDHGVGSWMPWYYHAKLLFLLWLQLPSTQGASRLYLHFLRPFLLKHQRSIELFLRRLRMLGRSPEVLALASVWRSCVSLVPGLRVVFVDQEEMQETQQQAQQQAQQAHRGFGSILDDDVGHQHDA